jgi:hypothetical protein
MRILTNHIYTGAMVQGKSTTLNYKVKKRIDKPVSEWNIVPNTHEAIITQRDFETVSILMAQYARVSVNKESMYPLSGYVYCGDCGSSMTRSKIKKYTYYICRASFKKGVCSSHCIRDDVFENLVKNAICQHISFALDIREALNAAKHNLCQLKGGINVGEQISDREKEIEACTNFKKALYEDYQRGILEQEDFINFNKNYTTRIKELKLAVANLRKEAKLLLESDIPEEDSWLEHVREFINLPDLSRQAVISMILRIEVFTGKRVEIKFRYQDGLDAMQETLRILHAEKTSSSANGGVADA